MRSERNPSCVGVVFLATALSLATCFAAHGFQRLAITHFPDNIASLTLLNRDGSQRQRIFSRVGSINSPRWSPDGERILFEWSPGPFYDMELFVIDADGSNLIQLTNDPGLPDRPHGHDWLPNGSKVVYATYHGGAKGGVWLMDAAGGLARPVAQDAGIYRNVDLSLANGAIVYEKQEGIGTRIEIWMNRIDRDAPTHLSSIFGGVRPSLSPEGDRVVYRSGPDADGDLYIVDERGDVERRRLMKRGGAELVPRWLANGDIAFLDGDTRGHIVIVDSEDGSLIEEIDLTRAGVFGIESFDVFDGALAVSPAGRAAVTWGGLKATR